MTNNQTTVEANATANLDAVVTRLMFINITSAIIGLGQNLAYFLSTYVQDQDARQRSLRDILYASHPATYKRVLKLEEHTGC